LQQTAELDKEILSNQIFDESCSVIQLQLESVVNMRTPINVKQIENELRTPSPSGNKMLNQASSQMDEMVIGSV
jgi:hypothetical protein